MQTTTHPRSRDASGRASARAAGRLRNDIVEARIEAGQFLANERELARQLDVSRETLRRALKMLEREGLLQIVPRRGYRVLARANDPEKGAPIAFVLSAQAQQRNWTPRIDAVLSAFQKVASERGWPLLVVGAPDMPADAVLAQLRTTRACGLVVDTADPAMLAPAREAGLPVVIVNDWLHGEDVDSVMQDGQQGGMMAVEHLLARGRRRIAWLGPSPSGSTHAFDRYSGASAALARAGLTFAAQLAFGGEEPREEQIGRLLSGPGRPDGFVALWGGVAHAAASAAHRLGLVPGRDIDLVGWSVAELYESEYVAGFRDSPAAPAMVWSAADLAETAVARLEARRLSPRTPAIRIKIPVRLNAAAGPAQVLSQGDGK